MNKKHIRGGVILLALLLVVGCKNEAGKSIEQKYSEAYGACASKLIEVAPSIPTGEETEQTASIHAPLLNYVDSSVSEDGGYMSILPITIFFREIYKRDDFSVSDDTMKFAITPRSKEKGSDIVHEGKSNDSCTMRIVHGSDGWLRSNILFPPSKEEGNTTSYFIADIKYDFDTSVLYDFDLYAAFFTETNTEAEAVFHYKMEDDGTIKVLDTKTNDDDLETAKAFVQERYNEFKELSANAKDAGDFSNEYNKAMYESAVAVYGDAYPYEPAYVYE